MAFMFVLGVLTRVLGNGIKRKWIGERIRYPLDLLRLDIGVLEEWESCKLLIPLERRTARGGEKQEWSVDWVGGK